MSWHSCMLKIGLIGLNVFFSMHDGMMGWHSCMLRELELMGVNYLGM